MIPRHVSKAFSTAKRLQTRAKDMNAVVEEKRIKQKWAFRDEGSPP